MTKLELQHQDLYIIAAALLCFIVSLIVQPDLLKLFFMLVFIFLCTRLSGELNR